MKITTESFKKEIQELYPNIEILGEWNGVKSKIECQCIIDNYEWFVNPRTIRKTGCPKCNGSITRKITDSEYKEKLSEMHGDKIQSLEPYISMNTNILHKCNKHNYEYYAKPAKVLAGQECKYCAKEKIGDTHRGTKEEFLIRFNDLCGDEYELLEESYKNNSTKMLFCHHMKNDNSHTFFSTANSILSNQGCGVCHGQQICVGYNDIATTNPYVASLFKNEEETHLYTEWSSQYVNFKCPNCGHIRNKMISQVSRDNDMCCPICGDGYSYPNKFIYNCLLQIESKLDFVQREYSPEWCEFDFYGTKKTGTYDIYFSVNNRKYIIEMDGGLGHGNRTLGMKQSDSLLIDSEKDRLALDNGILVIRINCDYGRTGKYKYIRNNILDSELSKIINFDLIDFEKANLESQSSLLIQCCNLWNKGLSSQEIAKEIHVVGSTITNYLSNGLKLGICNDYSPTESMYRSHGRDIICLNTKKIFRSIVDGAKYYGLHSSSVSKCCRKEVSHSGIYNNEEMVWMYLDEYTTMTKEEIKNYIPKENNALTKVVCLNTKQVFNKLKDASLWCGSKATTGIVNCCTGKYHTSGKHPITKEPLMWMYYKDYLESTVS